jgi:ABC-type transport system substrate-binding protein
MQATSPRSLYCADESETDTHRACAQVFDSLYAFDTADAGVLPALAESCDPDDELTHWTCTLREGVRFHDGAWLDANDVVLSYVVQWDAEHPLHKGREGTFQLFLDRFDGFLRPPAPSG